MNKNEREQILELLMTIKAGVKHASEDINGERNLINDCSVALQSILSFLVEKNQGYNPETILNCIEKLNKCSRLDVVNGKESLIYIEKLLEELIESISIIKKKKIKALFLPYKASMWTSLESIWKAADADENCEAVVVPIPYHDLDSEKNKVRACYEGEKYPEYVPVTKFWEYDISEEKPDIIFIHNPYDDTNRLTRVLEEYYSRNLKKYTNMLVYVPYFVNYMFNMRVDIPIHGANREAYKYVDKIIVESDLIKEKYEQVKSNVGKVLALGSPKLDSIYEIREHGIEDNSNIKITDKKVFLLITTLSFYSRRGKEALELIIKVYNEVMQNDNNVLMWRPHPLEENWIKNAFPQMHPIYMDIKNMFNNNNNVIIDFSEEYKYSIYMSDGVFSVDSSLINDVMVMGKPLFIIESHPALSKGTRILFDKNLNYDIDKNDMNDFIKNVIEGKEDKLYSDRIKLLSGEVKNIENGDSGKKIYEAIKSEILNKKHGGFHD